MGLTLLLALPLLAALLALPLRRWPRAMLLFSLAIMLLLWILLWLLQAETTAASATVEAPSLFGRIGVLTPAIRSLLLWLYPALTVVFLLAWWREEATAVIPSAFASLSFLTGALLVEPTSLNLILLIGVAATLLPMLNSQPSTLYPNPAAAGLRFLLFTTLAVPPLLMVNWLVSSGQGAQSSALFGFLLASLMLLGGFPFSVWVTAVTRQALLSALPLVMGLVQIGVVVFLLSMLNEAPVLGRGEVYQQLLQWSAAATMLLAALLLWRAADWREMLSHLVLLDVGLLLLPLSVPSPNTLTAALWLLGGRFISLLISCAGLTLWEQQEAAAGMEAESDNARRAPWSAGLLFYGCLSLLGVPLTPGFSGRWLVLTQATTLPFWLVAAILLALSLAAAALARRLWPLLDASLFAAEAAAVSSDESRSVKWFVGAAVLIGLLLTFFPSLLAPYASQLPITTP